MSDLHDLVLELKDEFPLANVCVAGGYPLALAIGDKPKDMDVFITGLKLNLIAEAFIKRDKKLRIIGRDWHLKNGAAYANVNTSRTIVLALTYKGTDIDLIISSERLTNKELVASFDMDICEAIMDLNNWEPSLSPAATNALKNKVITYRGNDSHRNKLFGGHFNKSIRVHRYKQKFPGFKFIQEL